MDGDLNGSKVSDHNNSINSLASTDESFDKSLVKKRIKLSQEDRDKIKAEKEKLKKEREMLKMQREMAKLEKEKARIEKEKIKVVRERQILEEREKKQNEQQMKIRLKEEEKEKREKLKREKEEEKARIREAKEKEKQRRLEEKQAIIEEEARKKEMKAKLENKKLEKSRAVLFNFLKKSSNNDCSSSDDSITQNKRHTEDSFENTIDSLLASFDSKNFTILISEQNEDIKNLYLNCLLSGRRVPHYSKPPKNDDNYVEITAEELPEHYREAKYIYLKFYENVKPPYFGPKPQCSLINGRKPFVKVPSLDYKIDSDEEWDEGGPGESLSNTDSEPEEKDDYEIDNDFFVPHGYLSDDEFQDVINDTDPVTLKKNNRPLLKEQTLLAERSRRFTDRLIPQVIGCVWSSNKHLFSDNYEFLKQFKIVILPNK